MPNKQIQSLTVEGVTYDIVDNTSGYITGITSSDVTGALGFTPYNATNPNGYTTNTGTITKVKTTAGAHTVIDISSGAANFNVPTKTSHLTNDSGFITGYTETDPIFNASAAAGITSTDITNWNNKSDFSGSYDDLTNKPTIPAIPTNVSAFTNDAGYLTSYTETDPTVPAWAKASTKPSYTASEVGAVATSAVGAASGVVPLNASSKIDSTYLPSYVDDVIEGYYYNNKFWTSSAHTTEITGEAGKIYVDLTTNKTYRYGTSTFTEISQGSLVTVSRNLTSGTKSATITVDGTGYDIYSVSAPTVTQSATTGITIADHTTTAIYGVGSSTTSVTGVQASTTAVRGVKTGTNSTTTASKVTLGTNISVPNPSASDITVPIRADSDTTVPTAASSATTVPIKNTNATTVPTAASSATDCDDITAWNAGSGTLTFTMDTTDTKKLIISHTHTAPSLSYTARSITGVSGSTSIYGVQSTTTSVTGVSGSTTVRGVKTGTSSTTTASKVTMGTAISVPNVTGATDVTVPIRADSDTTVPIKDASATTVPIKDANSTTVVTGKTHSVTDNGHAHSI